MKPILVSGKKYTPWKVHFPRDYAPPDGRRFFKTEELALSAICDFKKGKTSTALGKRKADQFLYAESLLNGIPILTAVRFYLEHHGAVDGNATLGQACAAYWSAVATPTASPYYTVKVKQHLNRIQKALKSDNPHRCPTCPLVRFRPFQAPLFHRPTPFLPSNDHRATYANVEQLSRLYDNAKEGEGKGQN